MIICRLRFKGTLGTQAYCLPLMPEGRRPYILPDHSRPIQVVADPAITDPGTFICCILQQILKQSVLHSLAIK